MSRKKIFIFFVIFTTLFNLAPLHFASANYFEPAVITDVDNSNKKFPVITGVSLANTEVLIYDNMKYVGFADEAGTLNGKVSFKYTPKLALTEGEHRFSALARNKTSLVLSVFSNEAVIKIPTKTIANTSSSVPAPTMIEPNENTVTAKVMPLIKGLTVNNTKVNIYIDGVLNGGTSNLTHVSGTANFAYKPFLNLSTGHHTAWAVAIDQSGKVSQPSNILSFKIEEELPAPTVIDVIKKDNDKILLTGLVKNGLKVRVFVDHSFEQELEIDEHPSGTANFAYELKKALGDGAHIIYTTALDERGKESRWSNISNISIGREPSISPEAAEEDVEVLSMENDDFQRLKELLVLARLFSENKEIDIDAKDIISLKDILNRKEELNLSQEEIDSLETLLREKEGEVDMSDEIKVNEEIKDIINQNNGDNGEKTGAINESKENQGKLRLNLIIFILFLIAVIVWIFWVNRELIKERREQNEEESKENKNNK